MKEPKNKKLPSGIWALGFVSLFMDISSETIHGLLPVFLISTLGASATVVGILEGIAEALVLVLKIFSGPISDLLPKRKPLVVLGYSMGAISKPLFALANSVPLVYVARIFDRTGKGIRGAPRDALIADLAPANLRGRAFGLRQSLDTVGAFLGPILAIALMKIFGGDYKLVFWFATIPGLISVFILVSGVKEEVNHTEKSYVTKLRFKDFKVFHTNFWIVAIAGAIFQLARFSEAFLILRAKDLGLAAEFTPAVLIMMNIVYSLSAYPIGLLSDKFSRENFLMFGMLILCISDFVLGFTNHFAGAVLGIALWGLHLGFTQGTLAALVADTCPPERKGTAYGIFNLFSAISLLFASVIAGFAWDRFGSSSTFYIGGFVALISLCFFVIWNIKFNPLKNI